MESSVSISLVITYISLLWVMMYLKLFLFGTGLMRKKRAQSFPYSLNTLKNFKTNIGSNSILMTQLN